MTNFNERIKRLAELEAKATPGPWAFHWSNYQGISGDYESPSWVETENKEFLEENGRFYGKEICHFNEAMFQNDFNDAEFIAKIRNEALPLLREMQNRIADLEDDYLYASSQDQMSLAENKRLQAENERLREGIKDVAEKYAEMEKLRSQFYTEKEQAETALLFANREVERLREGIGRAVEYLQHQFGYDDVLALEQEFRQISFGDVTEFMDFMKELEALHDA